VSVNDATATVCTCLPVTVTRSGTQPCAVLLEWAVTTSAAFYEVYRGASQGGPYDLIAATTNNLVTSFLDTSPVVQASYYIVKAVANGIIICQSDEVIGRYAVPPIALCKISRCPLIPANAALQWKRRPSTTGPTIRVAIQSHSQSNHLARSRKVRPRCD